MSVYSEKFDEKLFTNDNTSISKINNLINTKTKNILDIGCSSGYLGSYLKKKYNCQVWGVKIDKKDSRKASKKLDKVFNIDIENKKSLLKINTKFDTIIFADVLEHLKNPQSCLKSFYNKLTPNGEIITSIPNITNYETKLMLFNSKWKYEDFGLMDKTHKTFFDYDNIVNLFEESGFYIYKIDYTLSKVPFSILINKLTKSGIEINESILNNFFSTESNIFQYIVKAKIIKPKNYKKYLENKKDIISKSFYSFQEINNFKESQNEKLIKLNKDNKNLKKELNKIKSSKTYKAWQKFNKIKKVILKKKD